MAQRYTYRQKIMAIDLKNDGISIMGIRQQLNRFGLTMQRIRIWEREEIRRQRARFVASRVGPAQRRGNADRRRIQEDMEEERQRKRSRLLDRA